MFSKAQPNSKSYWQQRHNKNIAKQPEKHYSTKISFMKVIAIDTSCDDTSVAILQTRSQYLKILANIVSSQVKIHQPYGGIYPFLAKREHQRNLVPVLLKALKYAKMLKEKAKTTSTNKDCFERWQAARIMRHDSLLLQNTQALFRYEPPHIDAVAVTVGPGLEPCLWQGVNLAKVLSRWCEAPIVPVNHLKAHLAGVFLQNTKEFFPFSTLRFEHLYPAVGLVVSGGHTMLILMPRGDNYKVLGSTRDDAAGECFDKTARILGLSYPGGPAIASAAAKCSHLHCQFPKNKLEIKLPRPMLNSNDFDFSFSGLKTAVLYDWKKRKKTVRESADYKSLMAYHIEQAIVDVLVSKTIKAAQRFKVKNIFLAGGVACNNLLRKRFALAIKQTKEQFGFLVAPKKFCLDNAAMVGAWAVLNYPALKNKKVIVKANACLGAS